MCHAIAFCQEVSRQEGYMGRTVIEPSEGSEWVTITRFRNAEYLNQWKVRVMAPFLVLGHRLHHRRGHRRRRCEGGLSRRRRWPSCSITW
jgi:hypothetical protein